MLKTWLIGGVYGFLLASQATAQPAPQPTLPSGALLPPTRDFFDIDVVEELEKQRDLSACRFVAVPGPDEEKLAAEEVPPRYVYTCD